MFSQLANAINFREIYTKTELYSDFNNYAGILEMMALFVNRMIFFDNLFLKDYTDELRLY